MKDPDKKTPFDDEEEVLSVQNSLQISMPTNDAAIHLYRNLMSDGVARGRIERMRVEGKILTIQSRVDDIGELVDVSKAVDEAKKSVAAQKREEFFCITDSQGVGDTDCFEENSFPSQIPA